MPTLDVGSLLSPVLQNPRHGRALLSGTQPAVSPAPGWMVLLEGIWIGFDHDPGCKGDGELYWGATASDGAVLMTSSSKLAIGHDGVQRGVKEGSWLTVDRYPLYFSHTAPPYDHIAMGFHLHESDNGDETANILALFGNAAALAANVALPGVGPVAQAVVSAVASLVQLDDDDQALFGVRTALKATGGLRYRFFTLSHRDSPERRPCVAAFSLIPVGDAGTRFFYYPADPEHTVNLVGKTVIPGMPEGGGQWLVKDLPVIPQKGQLSLLLRAPHPGFPPFVAIEVHKGGQSIVSATWNTAENAAWCIESLPVTPGTYSLHLAQVFPGVPFVPKLPIRLGVIYSAD